MTVLGGFVDKFPLNRILMNVILMMRKVFRVTNPMISESALPDFTLAPENGSESIRISALYEWNRVLDSYVLRGSDQQMNVFWHHNEGVNLKAAFAAVAVHGLKEHAHVILDDEQPAPVPGRERYEVSSGRGDKTSRLQEQTSAAKAAIFAKPKSARVELVPFPVVFIPALFILGNTQNIA